MSRERKKASAALFFVCFRSRVVQRDDLSSDARKKQTNAAREKQKLALPSLMVFQRRASGSKRWRRRLRSFSVPRRSARRFVPRRAGKRTANAAREKSVTIAGRLKRRAGEAKRWRRCFSFVFGNASCRATTCSATRGKNKRMPRGKKNN
eukprot:3405188-Lingulodinium_polyedra.AAC.1